MSAVPPNNELGRLGSGSDATADALWAQAQLQHEDRYLRQAAQIAGWKRMAFVMSGIAALAVGGVVWIGIQSKYIPYTVEVDRLGQVLMVKVMDTENTPKTAIPKEVYREFFELVENLRSVTTDRDANDDRISKGFSRLRGAAHNYVRAELRKAPPNEVGKSKTVQIKVKSAQPLSGKTWLVEWEEHSRSLQGEEIGLEVWRATITWTQEEGAESEKKARRNPSGFYVDEMSWQKVISQ